MFSLSFATCQSCGISPPGFLLFQLHGYTLTFNWFPPRFVLGPQMLFQRQEAPPNCFDYQIGHLSLIVSNCILFCACDNVHSVQIAT